MATITSEAEKQICDIYRKLVDIHAFLRTTKYC